MSSKRRIDGHDERASFGVHGVDAASSSDESTIDTGNVGRATPDKPGHEPTNDASRSTPQASSHAHPPRETTDAHENAFAHAHPAAEVDASRASGPFPHEKLDVYRVALEMAALARKLAEQIPRGHRSLADHLLRAASNTVLLYAEGANRRGAAQKRQRFVESRGECGEVAAAGDLILAFHIGAASHAVKLKHLAARVSAMLTRLIARLE